MFKVTQSYISLALLSVVAVLPIGASAGGTPEDVKAFKENMAKAEAGEGFPVGSYGPIASPFSQLDASGKTISADSPTPGALVANAYLSGVGVDRDESAALLWYLRTKYQKGLNVEGFKALIKSMSAAQIYSVVRRTRSEESEKFYNKFNNTTAVPDATAELSQKFIPIVNLRASSSGNYNNFGQTGFGSFIETAGWAHSRLALLVEFNENAKTGASQDDSIWNAVSILDSMDNKSVSVKVSFTHSPSESDKVLFSEASARIKAKFDALLANSSSANSSEMDQVASAYAKGRFGLKADPNEQKRWASLAREARINEAEKMRAKAERGGPIDWLEIASNSKWSSRDEKAILGGYDFWSYRYLEIMGLKAEAGDPASIDGMISHLGELVRDSGGIRASQRSGELIRWIGVRYETSKSPEDAILLAHHYNAQNKPDLARSLAYEYRLGLLIKAKAGSPSEMLKLALLADPNWYEKVEGEIGGFSPGEIRIAFSHSRFNEFYSFREHGRLLKQFDMVGSSFPLDLRDDLTVNPFSEAGAAALATGWNNVTVRSIYLKYLDMFPKQEASARPFSPSLLGPNSYEEYAVVLRYMAEQDQLASDRYHEVSGGEKDFKVSLRWYRQLAEMGELQSLSFIARSFEKGEGVPRDLASAYAYYALAGEGPGYRVQSPELEATYQATRGTNEQKLDACFKLSPAEKERALQVYNDYVTRLTSRLERLIKLYSAEWLAQEAQARRDYEAQKAAEAKPAKK